MPSAEPVYRVLQQEMPRTLDELHAEEFRYGARILYIDGPPPARPVRVDGTVIHSTLAETSYFLGDRNPILEHLDAFQRIENDKYFEAELVTSVAPEAFARTELVGRIWPKPSGGSPEAYLAKLEWEMRKRYPRGFVLKPIASFASDGTFPTERTPFIALWNAYRAESRSASAHLRAAGVEATALAGKLKKLPSYPGRILDTLLECPESVMIQERLDIAEHDGVIEEYRVHVVDGQVLAGATQHRWGNYRVLEPARVREVEAFVQAIIRKLPAPYDVLTYGVDAVGLRDGSLAYMEGNAGWESQYFYAEFDVWVANLVASHYAGRPTPFLDRFQRFAAAAGVGAKIDQLREMLTHRALIDVVAEGDPVTEVLAQARRVLLDELRRFPTRDDLELVLEAILEFKLEPYFSNGELREIDEIALQQVA